MKRANIFALTAAWVSGCLAQSACSGQQYNDIPGFPASQSACYPTNYYRTSDLGQTSPSDAQQRCQQQCTSDSQCGSVVAQVNNAAGNPGFYPSGTCFFYATGQTVTPRQCANTAYLLEGYMKDNTLGCFSSSKVAASAFCSSYLHIPLVTSTVTSTPASTSTTVTVTTSPTVTTTATISATATRTVTVTVTTTTVAGTATITSTATTSATVTTTATTTTTVTVNAKLKRTQRRGVRHPVRRGIKEMLVRPHSSVSKRAVATVPAPACVTSGTPSTRLSAACSCLSVPTSTTTTTTTLPRVTNTMTTTATVTVTSTVSTTVTSATVTSSVTVTTTTGVSATVTTTTTQTNTATVTVTTTATATATAAPACTSGLQCIDGNQFETFCQESISPQGYSPSATLNGIANGQACLQSCSNDPQCNLYNYEYNTQVCTLYYNVPSSANLAYNADIEAASGYYTGSC